MARVITVWKSMPYPSESPEEALHARGTLTMRIGNVYRSAMAQKASARMYERVNITLPRETLGLLDRVINKGNRSRFINDAIRARIASIGRAGLRKKLTEGYAARAGRDLQLVEEWFHVDEEAWEHAEVRRQQRRK